MGEYWHRFRLPAPREQARLGGQLEGTRAVRAGPAATSPGRPAPAPARGWRGLVTVDRAG